VSAIFIDNNQQLGNTILVTGFIRHEYISLKGYISSIVNMSSLRTLNSHLEINFIAKNKRYKCARGFNSLLLITRTVLIEKQHKHYTTKKVER